LPGTFERTRYPQAQQRSTEESTGGGTVSIKSFEQECREKDAEIEAFKQAHATALNTQLILGKEIERLKEENARLLGLWTQAAELLPNEEGSEMNMRDRQEDDDE
jgi:hypothetical protein